MPVRTEEVKSNQDCDAGRRMLCGRNGLGAINSRFVEQQQWSRVSSAEAERISFAASALFRRPFCSVETRVRRLPFWRKEVMLWQCAETAGGPVHWFLEGPHGVSWLDGQSARLHEVNALTPRLFGRRGAVLDYLRFFCNVVWADEGPFLIVESDEEVNGHVEDGSTVPGPMVAGNREEGWSAQAAIAYGDAVFLADFQIHETGEVEMLNDEPIQAMTCRPFFEETEGEPGTNTPPGPGHVLDAIAQSVAAGDHGAPAICGGSTVTNPDKPRVRVLDGIQPASDPNISGLLDGYRCLLDPLQLATVDMRMIETIRRDLEIEFPNFREVTGYLFGHLSLGLALGSRVIRFPPVLLLGTSGIGKTRFPRILAERLALPWRLFAMGGTTDNRAFEGTDIGWSSRQPSWLADCFRQLQVANPLLLLDEADKAGGSDQNGRMVHSLLQMLEAVENASRWMDPCLRGRLDLGHVNWILTANDISQMPAPLLDRVTVFRVEPPGESEQIIAKMREEIAGRFGAPAQLLPPVLPETVDAIREAMAAGASLRQVRSALLRAMAVTAPMRGTMH